MHSAHSTLFLYEELYVCLGERAFFLATGSINLSSQPSFLDPLLKGARRSRTILYDYRTIL